MDINSACDAIYKYLIDWYDKNKKYGMGGHDLYYAKQEFIKQNPEYEKFDRDIDVDYIVLADSEGCACFECMPQRAKCVGIKVTPIDWAGQRELAKPRVPKKKMEWRWVGSCDLSRWEVA